MSADSDFERLLHALAPWQDQMVIIGGWAHRLYRLHPQAVKLDYPPLTTLDTDVAIPEALPVNERDIRDRLHAAGFTEEFFGDEQPPATHYRLGTSEHGFYAEFLSPLVGAEYDRRNRRRATAQVGGVTAQRLRHVGLLLDDPWVVEAHLGSGFRAARAVRVAHPVRFLAQKVLIHARRSPHERAKDLLYIHDTLEVCGARLEELGAEWETKVAPALHRRDVARVRAAAERLFGEASDDLRTAVRMAAGRSLTTESMRELCQFGLDLLFGRGRGLVPIR